MPIHIQDQGWVVETRSTAYAIGLNPDGTVTHRYWGDKLPLLSDYPSLAKPEGWVSFNGPVQRTQSEYPAYAGPAYLEPCLKVSFADGVRDTVLRFERAEASDDTLTLHLRDAYYPFEVQLHYRAHAEYDLIERWVTVHNSGSEPISIERIFSAQWHLPLSSEYYRFTHLNGRWIDETHVRRELLTQGTKVIESRRLTTSHHHNPWFAIDRGTSTEEAGEVWFGVLAWSGNWKLTAELTDFLSTRINLGINDWDFVWNLEAGETFTTPSSLAGYTRAGFTGASHNLHDYIRDQVLPHGKVPHKVLYNSWEATTFAVDEQSQGELAELAAEMGVELFVMDDGWFPARNKDNAGLGDWWPDPQKFPNGLSPLIKRVNDLGMDFGLWFEPEMVNPNSDLYRAHPDWVIHFPNRDRTLLRDQLILNFARTDVQDYIIDLMDKMLSENNISFIKWDMNRNVSEPGWPDAPRDQRELWVRYVHGVYHVWSTLAKRHPHVIWQSCSGGGGRADLGILKLADQVWISDNTEPAARLNIQEGYSHVFPANTMEAWVTDMGSKHYSLEFRFHVSMCGSLGVGGHLIHWGPELRAEAAQYIALYKEIRETVQLGDQYRLRSPHEHGFSAVQYVSKDKSEAVLFAFRTHLPFPAQFAPLYLRGLDPQGVYTVEGFEGARSGAAWMNSGLTIELEHDFSSTVRRIRRVS
jgi:alpha-galactosidase